VASSRQYQPARVEDVGPGVRKFVNYELSGFWAQGVPASSRTGRGSEERQSRGVGELGPWMTRPHGFVEFAGAERSSWPDNMEGAVHSGERAALHTFAALRA
jgi:hypothetical protein